MKIAKMFTTKSNMNPEVKRAFEVVIRELNKEAVCKKYATCCFGCAMGRVVEDLEDYYKMMKGR